MLGGFPFYAPKVKAKEETAKLIKEVMAGEESFSKFLASGKFCGGFHADYALAWEVEGKKFAIMICLRCGEAEFVGRDMKEGGSGDRVTGDRFDLGTEAAATLKKIFEEFEAMRPEPKEPEEVE